MIFIISEILRDRVNFQFSTFSADLFLNPFALRKAKTAYNFGLFECNRVKSTLITASASFKTL